MVCFQHEICCFNFPNPINIFPNFFFSLSHPRFFLSFFFSSFYFPLTSIIFSFSLKLFPSVIKKKFFFFLFSFKLYLYILLYFSFHHFPSIIFHLHSFSSFYFLKKFSLFLLYIFSLSFNSYFFLPIKFPTII